MHTAPSSTVVIETMSPAAASAAYVSVPARFTAAPSTNWSTCSSVTGSPAANAAIIAAAPAGSTPSTDVLSGALGQIGGDAGDAAAAADRNDDQIRFVVELVEDLGGDGALPRHRAQIVVRRNERRTGARDVVQRGRGGLVVGLARRRSAR